MKRKIAAILAADVVGYSRLMAEDEEETLRRLISYRAVFDDFVKKGDGRIFNTAGDAVLAEFPSAVDALRAAIDIQESIRTRNLSYPASRHMVFRIGLTIGDVIEREGDLLGDGVNIAARLQGLAMPGGICISRSVHEQVANKLSVLFSDLGPQEVKNIPQPIHAYRVQLENTSHDRIMTAPSLMPSKTANRSMPLLIIIAALLVIVSAAGTFFFSNMPRANQGRNDQIADTNRSPNDVISKPEPLPLPETAPIVRSGSRVASSGISVAFDKSLRAIIASTTPSLSADEKESLLRRYAESKLVKGLAFQDTYRRYFISELLDDRDTAGDRTLEACQIRFGMPCALIAVDEDTMTEGKLTYRNMSRVNYSGEFDLAQIPAIRSATRARSDLQKYFGSGRPRAIAIHPWGELFISDADKSIEAQAAALTRCNQFGRDKGDGPCFLYAVSNEVVLTERRTQPK